MRLVLAIELHADNEKLIPQAVQWAERMGAVLDIATVDEYQYNLYLVQDPAVRTVLDGQWTEIHDQMRQRLDAIVDALPEPVRGHALFLSGRASDQIVAAGASRDAILIGTHGRRGVSHFLLGSVAERVIRTATVPVVVLRLAEDA